MRKKLEALTNLQKVDLEILEVAKAGETHPRRLQEIESRLSAALAIQQAERSKLAESEGQKRSLEESLAEEKEKVKKWESRLAEMRTTREYSALAREIDIAKKANKNTEDEILALAQALEAQQGVVAAKAKEFQEIEAALSSERKELKGKMGAVEGRLKDLEKRRTETLKQVDPTLLRKYESIRQRRGIALVAVVAGTCRGCNMNLPPQLATTLRAHHTIEICPSCNRLVYAQEALEELASNPQTA